MKQSAKGRSVQKVRAETPDERARSERAYIQFMQQEAAITKHKPEDADALPEEDAEGDDE
jgi:hypothetical protein